MRVNKNLPKPSRGFVKGFRPRAITIQFEFTKKNLKTIHIGS